MLGRPNPFGGLQFHIQRGLERRRGWLYRAGPGRSASAARAALADLGRPELHRARRRHVRDPREQYRVLLTLSDAAGRAFGFLAELVCKDGLERRVEWTRQPLASGLCRQKPEQYDHHGRLQQLQQHQLMLVKTFGSAVYGVEAISITIEVNVSNGQNYFIVGLPDSAVKESLQRIESAIKNNARNSL